MKITAHYRFVQPEEPIALCARNGRCLLYTSWRISVARLRSSRNLTLEGTGLSFKINCRDRPYLWEVSAPSECSLKRPAFVTNRKSARERGRQTNKPACWHAQTQSRYMHTDSYIYTHREQKETRIHERRHAVFVISDTRCSEGFLVFA